MNRKKRIGLFFSIIIALGLIISFFSNPVSKDVKLGLDLQGGFEVLYQVEKLKEGQEITEVHG